MISISSAGPPQRQNLKRWRFLSCYTSRAFAVRASFDALDLSSFQDHSGVGKEKQKVVFSQQVFIHPDMVVKYMLMIMHAHDAFQYCVY